MTSAARAMRRGGYCLLSASAVFALTGTLDPLLCATTLFGAVVLLTLTELLQSAGSWGLSYDLADTARLGEYQGAWSVGTQLVRSCGPFLVPGPLGPGRDRLAGDRPDLRRGSGLRRAPVPPERVVPDPTDTAVVTRLGRRRAARRTPTRSRYFDVVPRNLHGQRSVYRPVIDRMAVTRLFRTRVPGAA
ncbi:hypothetical protein [Streptomyces canus]|uniref:hypothetical protein n=1 Tax=Streptomyces canus TaxID=58343 RepID=UPI002E2CAF74|nr:hypothetical protein [Streptomyces canus]